MADSNLGSSPMLTRRENLATPGPFNSGALVGQNKVNKDTDTRPTSKVRGSFDRSRNLRNPTRVHYNKEGLATIPINSTPEKPPQVS